MTFAANHNGGKTQVNFNFPSGEGGDYWAINLLKTAATVKCINNGPIDPAQLDSDGYPISLTGSAMSGGVVWACTRPLASARPGNYKLTWDGNGTVNLNNGLTTVAGSNTSIAGSGSWTVNFTDPADYLLQVWITSVGSPRITNLKLFHVNDEPLLATETFGVQFKIKLRETNFGCYRFLNWQQGNTSHVSTWNTRKPVTHVTWAGQQYRSDLHCGDTSLSGFTYSVSAPSLNSATNSAWSGLIHGSIIHVNFAQAFTNPSIACTFTNGSANIVATGHAFSINDPVHFSPTAVLPINFSTYTHYFVKSVSGATITVAATAGGAAIVAGSAGSGSFTADPVLMLNVGGTGPIPIRSTYTVYLNSGLNAYPNIVSPSRDTIATLVYDDILKGWIKQGACTDTGASGIVNGVPPEIMLQLCGEMGAHPHFVATAFALDPVTDYYPSLATYAKNNGPSWMVPTYEPPNELWNNGSGFYQTSHADCKAHAYASWLSGSPNYQDWYGKAASVYGQAIAAVYGVLKANVKSQALYRFGIGVQTGVSPSATVDRFDSGKYVAQSEAVQSGAVAYNYGTYTKDAAKDWTTHLITAQYWNPAIVEDPPTEASMAALFVGGDASQAQTFLDSATSAATFSLPGLATINSGWKTYAQSKGINKHLGYEGGYYPAFRTANQKAMEIAAKLLPNMKVYTKTNIANFFSLSDGGYTAEWPSQFQFSGSVYTGAIVDEWSMYDDVYESAKPMAQAFIEINQTPKFINLRLRLHA